jgi:DNA-binding GntR family transcriptional regulator
MPRSRTPPTTDSDQTLGQRAYRQLRQQIIEGTLPAGQRLSLRKMAVILGMSIAPVDQAFRELSRDGLIEMDPGWGARVRRIDAETLRNQHILRTALECEAARHCAARATDEQLDELGALADELDARIDSHAEPKQVHELDSQFHLRIAQLSGAACLVEALRANQLVRMLARGSVIAHQVARPPQQHAELVAALRTRDADHAGQAMRAHCVRSMELQLAYLTTSLEDRS